MDIKPKRYITINETPKDFKYKDLKEGCCGKCYLTKDGRVFKEFHGDTLDKYNLKKFTYIKSDLINFPRVIIYKQYYRDDSIIGYIREYADGTFFDELTGNEKMNDIITASDQLEKELKSVAEQGIAVDDVHNGNIIFTTDKKIKLFDTDLYDYREFEEPYYLYRHSLKEYGNFLMTSFNATYPYNNNELTEQYTHLIFSGKVKPSYILEFMTEEMNKQLDHPIDTIGEFKESQKLIKKL